MQGYITVKYLKNRKSRKPVPTKELKQLPIVTVQLPIYNEKYVIERLINAVIAFNYPKEKLEIQILDDSNDETSEIVDNCITKFQRSGFDISRIIRTSREDFKAGALKFGLNLSKGKFIAIFDADFIPHKDFLIETLPFFENSQVGVVQTRWGHLNEKYSILTQLQAYALNAHFTIEQTGRNIGNHFINFNGTAGIWRKDTILDAGGWEGDTLTEDLDLSYRAQLRGWKFKYLEEVISPAELPAEMNALKSQQFRWAKGAAECSRKNLVNVLSDNNIGISTKIHALFHLLNSFIWVCLLGAALLLFPFQYALHTQPYLQQYINVFIIFELSFILLFSFYLTANIVANPDVSWYKNLLLILLYPLFLTFSMGLSVYNTIGVLEGYLGKKSPFIRTPKFNIRTEKDSIRTKSYVQLKLSGISIIEFGLMFYFAFSSYVTFNYENYQAFIFLVMMTIGIALVFILSVLHYYKANNS